MAWNIAAWSRAKKLPNLKKLLRKFRADGSDDLKPDADAGEARRIGKMAEEHLRSIGRKF